ncbi:prion-like-(Q/N-rich) domain-bearing protein 25 [Anopheles albimanus]|uniref:EB domain-containing protein n=1 Tax=Anopheles albimanus TaxID=7167 RepID=A0A8W7K0A3_ANOAL|nr:prion-like-(Q/N-rich) domain-bearing protein 25 [Anopheles albimanus]
MYRLCFLILTLSLAYSNAKDIVDLTCESDDDCAPFRSATINSTCEEEQCRCTDLQHEQANATECRPVVNRVSNQIGGQCPCQVANSFCNEQTGRCICKEGFQPSHVEKKCVQKSVALGQECEESSQCSNHDPFAHCDDKQVCACQGQFVIYENACHSIIVVPNLTKPCEKDEECGNGTVSAVCQAGQCVCGKGYVADSSNSSSCLAVAAHDQPCTDSNQCIATLGVGSLCHQQRCACDSNHFQFPRHIVDENSRQQTIRNVCERKIVHGDSCNDDQNCYQFHVGPHQQSMECFMNVCVCLSGYTEKNNVCLKTSSGTVFPPATVLIATLATLITAAASQWSI